MARKTLTAIDPKLSTATEEFRSLSAVKHEMAADVYELQDDETKKVIGRIAGTLRQNASGYVNLRVGTQTGSAGGVVEEGQQ